MCVWGTNQIFFEGHFQRCFRRLFSPEETPLKGKRQDLRAPLSNLSFDMKVFSTDELAPLGMITARKPAKFKHVSPLPGGSVCGGRFHV